jgi:hypothetical protein
MRAADKAAGIIFGLEAGKYLASLGIKFAYKSPKAALYAAKYRGD